MPSTSKKQAHLMAAVAHNPAFAKKVGIPQSVGKEFNKADTGKTFKKGGVMKESKAMEQRHVAAMKKAGVPKKIVREEQAEANAMKKGGMAKETMGPKGMGQDVEKGSNKLTKFGESAVQKRGHTKGTNLGDSGKNVIVGMKSGGAVFRKVADGIASKGKTKATQVKMCGGGMSKGKKK